MAKELLNEAERFLLDHWSESRQLEESMEEVRNKYKVLFQRVVDAVTEAHPELNVSEARVTQFWAKGYIWFGRKVWPGSDADWPPGLWVDHLRLEKLSDEDSDPPVASISISAKTAKMANIDLTEVLADVVNEAQKILSKEDFDQCGKTDVDKEVMVTFPMPSKRELLSMFSDGDGQRLVGYFVSQFDLLARFVPVLNKILLKNG